MLANIVIIGEQCEDIFIYGKCDRICPEAPVPVFEPLNKVSNGGMSKNVYNNVKALNTGVTDIIANKRKIKKTRYVESSSNQMIMRLDEKDKSERINWNRIKLNKDYDAIIISDYNKGFLEIEDIKHIVGIASAYNIPVFLDTKKIFKDIDYDFLKDVFVFKVNEKEYLSNKKFFYKIQKVTNIIKTMGSQGAIHINNDVEKHYSLKSIANTLDLSGAGDTFMSCLVLEYLRTKSINKAIDFANYCSSHVVKQKGVSVIEANIITKYSEI